MLPNNGVGMPCAVSRVNCCFVLSQTKRSPDALKPSAVRSMSSVARAPEEAAAMPSTHPVISTNSLADSDCTEPAVLETWTEKLLPASAVVTVGIENFESVAPEMGEPLRSHWYETAVLDCTSTRNSAEAPAFTVTCAGCEVILGGAAAGPSSPPPHADTSRATAAKVSVRRVRVVSSKGSVKGMDVLWVEMGPARARASDQCA